MQSQIDRLIVQLRPDMNAVKLRAWEVGGIRLPAVPFRLRQRCPWGDPCSASGLRLQQDAPDARESSSDSPFFVIECMA
eukprot:15484760-Alexandrium_andersonii.AAC.1